MSYYLVKHGDGDIRLHAEDGTEPLSSGWGSWPSRTEIAEQIAADGPGGSLLGDPSLRPAFVDTVTGGLKERDLTRDGETVPW